MISILLLVITKPTGFKFAYSFPKILHIFCVFSGSPDVWQCLAELCNSLASVYHGEIPLFKADADGESDELRLLVLEEDRMLAGFVPLLAAPQEPCYIEPQSDTVSLNCL